MPRIRRKVDERRAELLALGIAMFSAEPYDEVSIDEIARAARVSKGLLYHYFPTKRDLYVAALREAARQLLERTITDRALPPEERARLGLEAYLDFVKGHGGAYVALVRGGIGSDPAVAAILEETRGTLVDRILEDAPRGSGTSLLRAALHGWIGFVEATSVHWLVHKKPSRKALVALLSGVLFDVVGRAAAAAATNY
jgi:AcrR family transcriptional regulator